MFGVNKKQVEENPNANGKSTQNPNSFNNLVKGTIVEGTITSDSDIRIDGIIKGTLLCEAKVIIGPTGFISGEVRCKSAMVEGRFEGKLTVAELLNVRETAEVNGEVSTGKLIVQSGAIFNVTCAMGLQQSNGSGEYKQTLKPISGQAANNQKEAS